MTQFEDLMTRLETECNALVVLGTDDEEAGSTLGEFAVVVDSGDEQAVIETGWDSSGVYVDVRLFRDGTFVEGSVTDILGEISVRPGASD